MSKSEDKRLAVQAPDPYVQAMAKLAEWTAAMDIGWVPVEFMYPNRGVTVEVLRYGEVIRSEHQDLYSTDYWRPIPPAEPIAAPLSGVELIAAERKRQVEVESWTQEHDDGHTNGDLAVVAATLAVDGTAAKVVDPLGRGSPESVKQYEMAMVGAYNGPQYKTFGDHWNLVQKHRGNRIKQLSIAGALVAAEIDRFVRIGYSMPDRREAGTYWRPIPPAPEPSEGMTEERLAEHEKHPGPWMAELCQEVRRLKLDGRVAELEDEITKLELLLSPEAMDTVEYIAACREECDELKAAVRRLQSEKDCWQAACSRGDLDIAELEKNVVMARNHVVSQAGELADRDARIAELEKQLASMTALCGDREQAMFSYRNKLELSERKVAHLEAEVAVLLQAEPPAAEPHQQPCPECGGTGVVDDGNIPCGACGGSGADTPVAEPHVSDEELARWEFQLVNYVPEGEWIPFDSYRMCQELRRLQSLVRPVAVDTGEHGG